MRKVIWLPFKTLTPPRRPLTRKEYAVVIADIEARQRDCPSNGSYFKSGKGLREWERVKKELGL